MMRIIITLVVSVLLIWSSNAFALGTLVIDLDSPLSLSGGGANLLSGFPFSTSSAWVKDSVGNFYGSGEVQSWPTSSAWASIGAGDASTAFDFSADPFNGMFYNNLDLHPPYNQQAWGASDIYTGWWWAKWAIRFEATDTATYKSNLNVLGNLDMTTELPGDWSYAYLYGYSWIYNENSDESHSTLWDRTLQVQNGADLSLLINELLISEVYLTAGQVGHFGGEIYIYGEAYSIIPAPGAILLGGIGVCLVGWLRRRRTI